MNDTYFRYVRDPSLFGREAREKIKQGVAWIIVDEIQRVPDLLNEVHNLLESSDVRFVLSGSSARKLKRSGGSRTLFSGFCSRHPLAGLSCGPFPVIAVTF
jgi:predicted AAA+ superfamily ATPase